MWKRTLVGADSVVKDLSILVAPNLHAYLIQTRKTIRRAIGKPLTE